jgi:hypothetical protein
MNKFVVNHYINRYVFILISIFSLVACSNRSAQCARELSPEEIDLQYNLLNIRMLANALSKNIAVENLPRFHRNCKADMNGNRFSTISGTYPQVQLDGRTFDCDECTPSIRRPSCTDEALKSCRSEDEKICKSNNSAAVSRIREACNASLLEY